MSEFASRYGPWAVVAGASEGIGAAFAAELAARGLNLLLLARRADVLEQVAAPLRGRVDVRAVPCDLARADEARAAIADVDVGLLVYNAAYAPIGAFAEVPPEDLTRALDVNCRGPLTLARALAPRLVARGRGGIVLMSSLSAFFGAPWIAAYGATKAFNLSLGEALWHELRPAGVHVLVCCAGATRTPGFERQTGGDGPRAMAPEALVRETLGALGRGPMVVPGGFNRFAGWILRRVLPRRLAVSIMGSQTRRLRPTLPATIKG